MVVLPYTLTELFQGCIVQNALIVVKYLEINAHLDNKGALKSDSC